MNEVTPDCVVPVSVVVPAHDEAAVIGRCLTTLLRGALPGELEVIVVSNGCTDDTAAVARAHAPEATVVELPIASKPAALNVGDQHATRFPRVYLDADVELPIGALRGLVRPLAEQRAAFTAPASQFVLQQRTPAVRAYLAVWREVARARDEPSGSGVYALSAVGRSRFRAFPDLIADDQFVVQQFHPRERLTVDAMQATVHPPMSLHAMLRVRTRVYRGNRELARSGLARYPAAGGAVTALLARARRPQHLLGVGVYVAVNLLARVLARTPRDAIWERDDGSRAVSTGALKSA
jgi:glycosyltransferase involved in cell wall biosynthesis